jgi:competence protein ComEC
MKHKGLGSLRVGLILFLGFCLWLGSSLYPRLFPSEAGTTNIWVLDVGQGESILIREPSGKKLLFDGGPDDSVLSELGIILPPWDRRLDLLVLSHNHIDHMRGFIKVLERYDVKELWISGAIHSTNDFQAFIATAYRSGIKPRIVFFSPAECFTICPKIIPFGEAGIQVYHPLSSMEGKSPKDQHDATLVIKVSFGSQSILLPGDIDEGHEKEMLAACKPKVCTLESTIFQAAHHGSASGLHPDFLKAVSPQAVLIPVGSKNRFGHPAPTILEKIKKAHIPVYRTDLRGRIHVVLYPERFTISTSLSEPP